MEKGKEQTPSQAPQAQGTYTRKTNPRDIWLWKAEGLTLQVFIISEAEH